MKSLILLACHVIAVLLFLPASLDAQTILNGDFSLWNDPGIENVEPSPESWSTNEGIGPSLGFATKCDGYEGFGAQVKAINLQGNVYSGMLSYGQATRTGYNLNSTHAGHPYSQRPTSFTGAYSFFPDLSDGDAAQVTVVLKKYNPQTNVADTIAFGVMSFTASFNMTGFELPLNYRNAATPDTLTIVFVQSKESTVDSDTTSYFRVDQLGFDQHVGISNNHGERLLNLYPNPSTHFIQTDWIRESSGNYIIFDNMGRNVTSGMVKQGDMIDVSPLVDGSYTILIANITGNDFVRSVFVKSGAGK